MDALLEVVHRLLENRDRWRAGAAQRGLLRTPKPADVPAFLAVDGAVAEEPTLGLRLYSACAYGITPEGEKVAVFDRESVAPSKKIRARMIALELALLSQLLEEYPEAFALADGSRISHLSALSGAGIKVENWPGNLPPASWGKNVAQSLQLAITSPRAVFVPKEESGPLQTRGVMGLLLEPGELYGPRPVKADLHLGGKRYANGVLRWYYALPSRNVVKLETLEDHPPIEVLAAIGTGSGSKGTPSPLALVDKLAKKGANLGLKLVKKHLLWKLPPEALMPLMGPYRS
jgi:hypothetical protein